uniref:Reverse transcriptase domain-containing protein n=1 Tax=Trichuris muris TaxID=70415 RepID=A0A5S6QMT9_TRIMR
MVCPMNIVRGNCWPGERTSPWKRQFPSYESMKKVSQKEYCSDQIATMKRKCSYCGKGKHVCLFSVLYRRDNFCFESQKDQPLAPRFNFDTTSLVSLLRPKAVVKQVTTQQTLREVLKKYAAIFEPGLGHCTKIMARVELKEGAVPVLRKPFPVAFALREAVEAELQRYVDMGVITPVEQTDWAAPIVIAKKPNKQVRLCADFSTDLNRALVTNAYPIPSPEDLYHALEGEVKYSKLDLSDAYP